MIKLPIHLSQHGSWQSAIAHAVDNRAWLEGIAARDGGGIRPIALYQAMPAREGAEATVDLARLAGLTPAGVLIEILNGTGMASRFNPAPPPGGSRSSRPS